MCNYKKTTTKSGRIKLEVHRWVGGKSWIDRYIYARPEQLEPYFDHSVKWFYIRSFLAHLDSYRTCGFVKHVPLDCVRVVTPPSESDRDDARSAEFSKAAEEMNRTRIYLQERRRKFVKGVGWQIYPPPKVDQR